MGNSLLTNDVIGRECMMSLKSNLVFTRKASREYSKEYAKKGAKIGNTFNIRKPTRYDVTEGRTLNIQDSADQSVALTVDKQYHVGMAFGQDDRSLSLDEFRARYIDPAMIALAHKIDSSFISAMYKQVYSSVGVPSATALPSTLKSFAFAKAKMELLGAPAGMAAAIVDPLVQATMVDGLKGLFHSSDEIGKQYKKGLMGEAAGCEFSSSASVAKHTSGNVAGTPKIATTVTANGTATVALDGITGSIAKVYSAGDVITFAGVYAVNPQTKESTGELAQFVVTADTGTSSSGAIASLPISPAIVLTGPYKNVSKAPTDEDAVHLFGAASTYAGLVVPQNLVFLKEAFALGSVDLELPDGGVKATRVSDDEAGLSLTMTQQFDITNYRQITRIDWLGGWKCIYPELACRVVGQLA